MIATPRRNLTAEASPHEPQSVTREDMLQNRDCQESNPQFLVWIAGYFGQIVRLAKKRLWRLHGKHLESIADRVTQRGPGSLRPKPRGGRPTNEQFHA